MPILGRLFGSKGDDQRQERDRAVDHAAGHPHAAAAVERDDRVLVRQRVADALGAVRERRRRRSAPATSGAGPAMPGGVSFGAGGAVESPPAPQRAAEPAARDAGADRRVGAPAPAPAAAPRPGGGAAAPDAKAAGGRKGSRSGRGGRDGGRAGRRPTRSRRSRSRVPTTAKVGDEISVSVKLASTLGARTHPDAGGLRRLGAAARQRGARRPRAVRRRTEGRR